MVRLTDSGGSYQRSAGSGGMCEVRASRSKIDSLLVKPLLCTFVDLTGASLAKADQHLTRTR